MCREAHVDQRELKGMGDNNEWCEGSMEIRVNGILMSELLCMSSFKNNKFQRSWWTEVVVAEKQVSSVLVSFRCAKLSSMRWTGQIPGLPHKRSLSQ